MIADGVPDCAEIDKLRGNEFCDHLDPVSGSLRNKPTEGEFEEFVQLVSWFFPGDLPLV